MGEDEFFRRFRKRFFSGFFDDIDKMFEEFEKGVVGSDKPIYYGYSVRVGPDGRPEVKEFGNLGSKRIVELPKAKEPIVEVIDEGRSIRLVSQMPGISREDLKLRYVEGGMDIYAERGSRKYHKLVRLPVVDPNPIKVILKNGLLEIVLAKRTSNENDRFS